MMKKILLTTLLLTGLTFAPATFAADDEEQVTVDARLEGYGTPVYMNKATNSSVWFLLLVLGVISTGVMFVNSKRTHLD